MYGSTVSSSADQQAPVVIFVLCGLPGCGKTSLCRELARSAVHQEVAVHHLCLDVLLKQCTTSGDEHLPDGCNSSCQAVAQCTAGAAAGEAEQQHADAQQHGQPLFTAEAWRASRNRLLQETQLRLQQHQEQQHGKQRMVLLVDDINHYRSMRYEFVQLARAHGAAFLQLYMDCPVELALQRNSQRQGLDALPAAVVTRLAAAFEQPQPGRHHWEEAATLTVHCCSGTVTQPGAHACTALSGAGDGVQGATAATDAGQGSSLAELVWRSLLAAWGPPLQPPPSGAELAARRAAGSAANTASALHALDLASRSMLHHALAACAQDKRAGAAAALNAHRKQLLERLKQQQQQQQVAPAYGTADAGADGEMQQLLDTFQQLCSEYM